MGYGGLVVSGRFKMSSDLPAYGIKIFRVDRFKCLRYAFVEISAACLALRFIGHLA